MIIAGAVGKIVTPIALYADRSVFKQIITSPENTTHFNFLIIYFRIRIVLEQILSDKIFFDSIVLP
jgi:hypothetical protein